MAEGEIRKTDAVKRFRESLRNANINYRNGWFFVTVQVAKNKSIFGAIVGEKVVLNELGQVVEAYWRRMPENYPELELFEFVVMPNHFHALIRIHYRETNHAHHLGFLMGRFKGGTSYLYGKLKRDGRVEDIGKYLWQLDYWDKLVTNDRQFVAYGRYIRENPKNWSRDRWGAVTSFSFGDLELLNRQRIAFVASQGYFASELRPKRVWPKTGTAKAVISDTGVAGAGKVVVADTGVAGAGKVGVPDTAGGTISEQAASAVLISTFTSAQEREALRRALAKKRPLIAVFPGGLPAPAELAPDLATACREGRALLVSPQCEGSRLNKKVATWCNEYVLRHSGEIWVGDIKPNGMLAAMLRTLKGVGL